MRRILLAATATLLLLGMLPTPMVAAQSAGPPSIATLWSDDFTGTTWTPSSGPNNPDGNSWHKVTDGTGDKARTGWYASRASSGGAAGYDDLVDVRLTSPAIDLPNGWLPRSVGLTIRGSSEAGFDFLAVEWSPNADAADSGWQTLARWSGGDLEESYRFQEAATGSFQGHTGPFHVRLRFTSNGDCNSDPTPGELPGAAAPVTDEFGDPTQESTDPCGGIGWFADRAEIVARRDFTALAPPDAPQVDVVASGPDKSIDLAFDSGKVLEFRLDPATVAVPAAVDSVLVRLDREDFPDVIDLAATKGNDGVWTALLAVDDTDLVAGIWDVQWFGTQSGSGSLLATSVLTVRVQDTVVPLIETVPDGNPVQLGVGQGIAIDVTESYLRKVTYTFEGLPEPFELPFPYVIPVTAFPEGPSKISLRAEDRAGNVAIREINVERDTVRPSVTILGPADVYAGVPFGLSLPIIERSAHTIRVDIGGTIVDMEGKAGEAAAGKTHVLQVTPPGVGELTVTATVVDALGNEAITVREFIAVLPVTDLRVNLVRLDSPATNTAEEGQEIVAEVEQVGGVAPLPVTVTFEAAGRSQAFTVTVPASGPFEVRWATKLPPGVNTVKVHATGPGPVDGNASYNETLPGNENGTTNVESFLGRITIGSKVYSVRADSRGLPTTVVQAGSTKTYPLTLVQTGSGVQYQFTADGNRTVLWDPLEPIQDVPVAASSPTKGGKDAPFPGLLLSLAVLALAALGQRRK